MITVMFGTSMIHAHPHILFWFATMIETLITFIVWTRTRSLDLTIRIGVIVTGVITLKF